MKVLDIREHPDKVTWEEYCALPGVSFSSLKEFKGPPSPGMRLGTRVHNYIMTPSLYDWEDAREVRAIASELYKWVPPALVRIMQAEMAMTATLEHEGFKLRFRGKPDLKKQGVVVIDFKILAGDLTSARERYDYDDQLRGYMAVAEAPLGLLIAFNKIKKRVEVARVVPNDRFWERIILERGEYNQ